MDSRDVNPKIGPNTTAVFPWRRQLVMRAQYCDARNVTYACRNTHSTNTAAWATSPKSPPAPDPVPVNARAAEMASNMRAHTAVVNRRVRWGP